MTLYIKEGWTVRPWTTLGSQLGAEQWSTCKSHGTHERNYSTSHIKHFGLVLPSSNPTGRKCPTYPLRWPDTFKSSLLLKKLLETAIFSKEERNFCSAQLHYISTCSTRTGAPLLRYCHCITEFLLQRVKKV